MLCYTLLMQKIIPHIWFSTEAKEATEFCTTLFPNSQIDHVNVITDTPSGDCDMRRFTQAFLKMKRFNIAEIQKAWEG